MKPPDRVVLTHFSCRARTGTAGRSRCPGTGTTRAGLGTGTAHLPCHTEAGPFSFGLGPWWPSGVSPFGQLYSESSCGNVVVEPSIFAIFSFSTTWDPNNFGQCVKVKLLEGSSLMLPLVLSIYFVGCRMHNFYILISIHRPCVFGATLSSPFRNDLDVFIMLS